MATDTTPTLEAIDAHAEALGRLRAWAAAHPEFEANCYHGRWFIHVDSVEHIATPMLDGAAPGSVTAEHHPGGQTRSLKRDYGAGVQLTALVMGVTSQPVTTVLNPAEPEAATA